MNYSIVVDYADDDNKRRRSSIAVEANDILAAYNLVRENMKDYKKVKLGAICPGIGLIHI